MKYGARWMDFKNMNADRVAPIRHYAVGSYILIKLIQGLVFGSVGKYILLTSDHPEAKDFKLLAADVGVAKILHLFLTAAALLFLLKPVRLAMLILVTFGNFSFLAGTLAYRLYFQVFPLLDNSMYLGAFSLAILLQSMDATMDALCQEHKVYLQGSRKLSSVLLALSAISQLWLPSSYAMFPPILLFTAAIGISVWLTASWFRAPEDIKNSIAQTSKSISSKSIRPGHFVLFLVTVFIGGNGEQVLDGLANLGIDNNVAGGKLGAATVKEGVTAIVNSFTFFGIFFINYKNRFSSSPNESSESKSIHREISVAKRVLLMWALVQVPRVAAQAWCHGDTAKLSSYVLISLIFADKLSGNLVEDAFGTIESYWLAAVARKDNNRTHVIFSPAFCQSITEVFEVVTATLVKHLVEATSDSHAHPYFKAANSWISTNIGIAVGLMVLYAIISHFKMAKIALTTLTTSSSSSSKGEKQM